MSHTAQLEKSLPITSDSTIHSSFDGIISTVMIIFRLAWWEERTSQTALIVRSPHRCVSQSIADHGSESLSAKRTTNRTRAWRP